MHVILNNFLNKEIINFTPTLPKQREKKIITKKYLNTRAPRAAIATYRATVAGLTRSPPPRQRLAALVLSIPWRRREAILGNRLESSQNYHATATEESHLPQQCRELQLF